jgi:SAM-dependent methyltransferase
MKYYDSIKDKLIFIGSRADPNFWSKHWEQYFEDSDYHLQDFRKTFPVRVTKKYLSTNSCVIDAGCGSGSVSIGLAQEGYQSIGLDFSEKTIAKLKKVVTFPNVQFIHDDVFQMERIADGVIDGYWSLGVIEHFWEGYDEILVHAHRVLKEEGMLFLTFPSISPLRRLKCLAGCYPELKVTREPKDFYQFALNKYNVINDLKKSGFSIIEVKGIDAVKGMKDEVPLVRTYLQRIYSSRKFSAKIFRFVFTLIFGRFSGHVTLIVAKKCS